MKPNQKCLIRILSEHSQPLSTAQLLDATSKYPDLCRSCNSGSEVISAGMTLVDLGIVKREVGKGGFLWTLTNQN